MSRNLCDHCNKQIGIIDLVDRQLMGPDVDYVIWCIDCLTSDKNILVKAGVTIDPTLLNFHNKSYYLWLWVDNIKRLRTVPKKNAENQIILNMPVKEVKEITMSFELNVPIPIQKSYCKKRYYGISCGCGECK